MNTCANNVIIVAKSPEIFLDEVYQQNLRTTLENCAKLVEKSEDITDAETDTTEYYVFKKSIINDYEQFGIAQLQGPRNKGLILRRKLIKDPTYLLPKQNIVEPESQEVSGGSKRRYKRKSSKKKKGGSVPINSQATVLQSASYAPSLDNSFLSQSTLVGGKKKRTQKKRKSLKKRSRK